MNIFARIGSDLSNKERTVGGLDIFLPYIRDYVNTFTGKSISPYQWKDHLYDYYKRNDPERVKLLDTVDWQVRITLDINSTDVHMGFDTVLAVRGGDGASR